jgi:hypothetical protein
MFENLCIQHKISTNELQIVSAVLSLDSKFALCIVQDVSDPENDRFVLQAFDVETIHKSPSWSIEYNGKNMTMKHIDQNNEGKMYALPYQDNGKYFVSIIDQVNGKEISKIDVNKHVQIDDKSKPIDDIYDPLITCCFTSSDQVFVSTYHRLQKRQHSFYYNISAQKSTKPHQVEVKDSTQINFPLRCFNNVANNEQYTFYRQGQVVTTKRPVEEGTEGPSNGLVV